MNAISTDSAQLNLVVSANFTAEPVESSLSYWLDNLRLPFSIEHAPFDQVFQQLLDPSSMLRSNREGIGLLLVRLQNWMDQESASAPDHDSCLDKIAQDFIAAVREAQDHSTSQLIVCFCPATGLDAAGSEQVARAERELTNSLREQGGVSVVSSASMLETYPLEEIADEHGERIASMPYTAPFFSVLGTVLARRIYRQTFPAHKVLVLDCDDTLWGGLCGELGPQGVALDEEHLALQRFAVEQRQDGKLICLASRNNEADVFAVFEQNPAMVLTRDDITATQINWGLKSDSLAELAAKLGLGLDSFVFLDDDPVQCAEVQRRFPTVLALQVPRHGVDGFCRHIWQLDPRASTGEGSRRTASYREHVAREDVRTSSQSFQQFLDSLELQVEIAALTESDLARATELTYRTNQFNLTGRRINEAEFRQLVLHESVPCFGVRVRDRFGDYGLVGLVIAEQDTAELRVPVMLLSCRSLGRGVEYKMVAHLGRLAGECGATRVVLHCVPSERNDPAREFLHQLGKVQTAADGTLSLELEADTALSAQLKLDAAPQQQQRPKTESRQTAENDSDAAEERVSFMASIPLALTSAATIHAAVHPGAGPESPVGSSDSTPETGREEDPVEELLMRVFSEQLGLSEVSDDVGFFELGGHSLQAMQILTQVSSAFGVELDPTLLFTTNFTIGELAEEINFLLENSEQELPGTGLSASSDR